MTTFHIRIIPSSFYTALYREHCVLGLFFDDNLLNDENKS